VDVVFAEVSLPEMSGFELAKAIRSRHPAIGVILTSGPAAAAQKSEDLCDGGPLPKPYRHDEVLRRIRLLKESKT
jgi:two-component SAPR family response regulator